MKGNRWSNNPHTFCVINVIHNKFRTWESPDGREITKRVEEEIPEDLNLENLDEFMSTFDDYERHALKARNGICEEITQAWLEQAKKGA